jgi:hypothetical protein
MHFDPKESCEARAEIGNRKQAAASSSSPEEHQDSPALRDPRGPQPASCRGEDAGQPFAFTLAPGGVIGTPLRSRRFVRQIRQTPTTVERIYAERRRTAERRAWGGFLGLVLTFILVLALTFYASTGGAF